MPKFPDIEVQLTGCDGNVFAVMGAVSRAMKQGGCTSAEVVAFMAEATAGDYDHLLQVCVQTVEVR